MLLISGVGGYGYQDEDWFKHNAILKALIDHPWPVSYSFLQNPSDAVSQIPLVYYMAYYLPSAVIGKMFGWFWANQALLVWTFLGLCLSILWFIVLTRRFTIVTIVMFVLFSGLDAIGLFWVRSFFLGQPVPFSQWWHIERWAGNWQYPANITSFFWVPNQGVAGWIGAGLIFYACLYTRTKRHLIFYLSLMSLWSPFVMLGLLPYIAVDFLLEKKSFSQKLRDYGSISNLCGLVILFIAGMFYLSRMYALPMPSISIASGLIFSHPLVTGLYWYETLELLLLFILLEFGVYGILIVLSRVPLTSQEKHILLVSMIVLTLLPFFRYGFWNDLVMRASAPALFLLSVLVVKILYAKSTRRGAVIILILVLFLGAVNSGIEIRRHIAKIYKRGKIFQLPEAKALHEVPNTQVNPSFYFQYVGSAESPFFQYIARPLQPSESVLTAEDILTP